MADGYVRVNKGSVFWNENKNKETQPDFSGSATIDGKEWGIGVWFSKTQKDGKLYMSMSFTEKVKSDGDDKPPF